MSPTDAQAQQALLDLLLAEAGIETRASRVRPRANRSAPAPLTRAQELLWWMHRTAPETTAYNMRWVVDISGPVDIDALSRALRAVAERHAILRSAFPLVDGEPRIQVVRDTLPVSVRDLRDHDIEAGRAIVADVVNIAATRCWDLEHDTPHAMLLRVSDDEMVLVVALHHMYSDGWSRAVFFRELGVAYQAATTGDVPPLTPLTPLTVDYADYAAWEHEWTRGEEHGRQLDAWRERLRGVPARLELPGATGVVSVGSAACRVETTLAPESLAALQGRARRGGRTLFALLLSALDVVVSRHACEEDVLIVTPTANRRFPESEPLIGFFANAVPIRTRVEPTLTFDALLDRVQADCIDAFERQGVLLERVLEVASDAGNAIRPQVMFSLQNAPREHVRLGRADVRRRRMPPPATRFDLAVSCTEVDGILHVALDFAPESFARDAAERFLAHYCNVLAAIAAGADGVVQALPLLSPAEREATLREWNPAFGPRVTDTVPAMIARRVATAPERAALIAEDGAVLDYGALDAWSAGVADACIDAGARSGARVAVCMDRTFALVASLLGVMRSGAAYVPMDPAFPPKRLARMLGDSAATLVLTDHASIRVANEAVADAVREGAARPVVLAIEDLPRSGTALRSAPSPDDTAYVLYTSGSTGRPKGVAVSHASLANLVVSIGSEPGITADDVLLAVTTVSFDIAGLELWAPLVAGARVALAPSTITNEGSALASMLESSAATIMQATPATWRMLLDSGWKPREALTMLCGGEALPPALADELLSSGASLWNMYGPTETTIWSALDRVRPGAPISLGRPLRNTALYVLEPGGEPAPIGVAGELFISGDGVAKGYLGQPELTRTRFVDDPFIGGGARMYRTGDRVRRNGDGRLEFLGRVDNQVKLRGFRIELGDVESALASLDGVRESAAVVLRGPDGDARLVGYVSPGGIDPRSVRARLHETLPAYMVPSVVVPVDVFPRTPNGKLDRKALPAPKWAPAPAPTARPAAEPLERVVMAMFAEVLRVDDVGPDTDFFEMGGHSLLATRLLARVELTHGRRVTFREFAAKPTPAGVAACIHRHEAGSPRARSDDALRREVREAPLTYQQELIWALDAADPDALVAYNVGELMRIAGPLDVSRLERAVNLVVERHDALRIRIVDSTDGVAQRVVADQHVAVEVLTSPAEGSEDAALTLLRDVARRPFDLRRDAPVRVHAVRVHAALHFVLIDIHHLVMDGWSKAVVLQELRALYDANGDAAVAQLPPVAIQYLAYAARQRAGAAERGADEFWERMLAGASAQLSLPTDRVRPAAPTFAGGRLTRVIRGPTAEVLARVGDGATPFMTLLSAFAALVARWSGESDILVGAPAAGRADPALDRTVGFLAGTLPLRIDVGGNPTFADLISRVRECAVGAFDHQDAAPRVLWSRGGGRAAIPQLLFSFQSEEPAAIALAGLGVERVELRRGTSKVDLAVYATAIPEGLRIAIEYRSELFDPGTIERLAERFEILLDTIAADPSRRVSEVVLTSARERALVDSWNATDVAWSHGERTLAQLIRDQALRTPDAVAVQADEATLSYRDLVSRASALAARLRADGVGPGALVGVCIDRSLELAIGLVAVLDAGGAYVPLDPEYPAARLRFMAEDAGFVVLLTREHLRDRVRVGDHVHVLTIESVTEVAPDEGVVGERHAHSDDLAYMIYTSGSTGTPKGAMNTHRGIVNRLLWMQRQYALTESDAVLQKTPISFDVSVWELFWPLITGARLVMAQPGGHRDAEYLAREIASRGITVAHFVPSMLRIFLSEPGAGTCVTLRDVMCSGEALTYDLQQAFFETLPGTRLHNLYGPTEAAVDVSYWECVPADPRGIVPIGRPVANTQLHVLDDRMQPVPIGFEGELYIGGVQVGAGYHNRPRLTEERFVADPFRSDRGARLYRTGDRARWRSDGVVEYLGRRDGQIKLRGFRIELGEIEAALAAHRDVAACAVDVRGDGPDARLVAFCVMRGTAAVSDEGLRMWLGDRLPEYMIPAAFARLSALPVTANGKLDRRALAEVAVHLEDAGGGAEPSSPTEIALAALWRQLLGVERVGVQSNFFALGGHSLLAMRVLGHVRHSWGVRIPLRGFFATPTLGALAAAIDAAIDAAARAARGSAVSVDAVATRVSRGEAGTSEEPKELGGTPDVAPLGHAQELLWMLEQASPGLAAYHLHDVARVRGALDVAALGRALDALVARHPALRTVVSTVEGRDVQRVLPAAPVDMTRMSVTAGIDALDLAEAAAREFIRRPFDLRAGPPFRAAVIDIGEFDALIVLVCHHLVSDGWSQGILRRDLTALYAGALHGKNAGLPPLAHSFAAAARTERSVGAEEELHEALEHWRHALAGVPAVLELPTIAQRPSSPSFAGASVATHLPAELVEALRELGRSHDATLFMVLLALVQVVLHRYSGQTDIVVGAPVAGRDDPRTQDVIGYFANTIAIRGRVEGDPSFGDFLERVRDACVDAYEHQGVPYERLSAELGRGAAAPLVQVLLALQNMDSHGLALEGLEVVPVRIGTGTAKFDLTLSGTERDGALELTLVYRTDLFARETAVEILDHLRVAAGAVVVDAQARASRIPLLSAEARARVIAARSGPSAPLAATTLDALLARAATVWPDAVAVETGHGALTYSELHRRANQLARRLRREGVGPEVLVGVCIDRSPEMIIALLAVLGAGGAYVPLDPEYPDERIAMMIEDAGLSLVVTSSEQAARVEVAARRVRALRLDQIAHELALESEEPLATSANGDSLAYVIFTSGSTGRPKGVMIPHRAVVNYVGWMCDAFPQHPGDGVLLKAPISFDASVLELYLPLACGARLVLAPKGAHRDPDQLFDVVRRASVGTIQFVPTLLSALVDLPDFAAAFTGVRTIICGGEALPAELAARVMDRVPHVALVNLYGPTETTVYSTMYAFDRGVAALAPGAAPLGRPIANTRVYVVDQNGEILPNGGCGEIWIGGAGVARGYLGRPDLTAERFVPDCITPDPDAQLYRTGDRGRIDANGTLHYLGRADHQVKLRGLRVELSEIEAALIETGEVTHAAAVVRVHGETQHLVAFYASRIGTSVSADALLARLRARLPSYMVPEALVALAAMPLTPSGKVDRGALPDVTVQPRERIVTPPATPVEARVATIWCDVLRLPDVDREDDFFAIGGNSLLAIRMITRVRDAFGVTPTMRSVFEAATLRAFSAHIESLAETSDASLAALLDELTGMSDDDAARLLDEGAGR